MNKPDQEWSESDIIALSALQHYSYCPRQCALIHLEQIFEENLYTIRGKQVHERVDEAESTMENGTRIERALPLWCDRLGLIGKADIVEFNGEIPYPIEYKQGFRYQRLPDELQLCGQAICLEEMTGQPVLKGAIYHHSSRRRREVVFTSSLRQLVETTTVAIRNMFRVELMPPPVNDCRCRHCSLIDSCMPKAISEKNHLHQLGKELFQEDQ